jgi:hypothetical protein
MRSKNAMIRVMVRMHGRLVEEIPLSKWKLQNYLCIGRKSPWVSHVSIYLINRETFVQDYYSRMFG